jgi:beta-hydroxylase
MATKHIAGAGIGKGFSLERGQSPFIRWIKKHRHGLNRWLARYSRVGNEPICDPALFPWLQPILGETAAIREEALRILRHGEAIPPFRDFAPGHERIAKRADDWRSFFFWGYGYPVEENLQRCPAVAGALANVPGLVSAIFSVVGPKAHIRRHRGVSKAIMTAHVPLIVPRLADRCRMEVDGRSVVWSMGRPVVFDDTYPHEVWNDSDEARVVLLIQFRRPMRQPGRIVADAVVAFIRNSSFVQRARRNLPYWEAAYAQAEKALEAED